VNDAGFWLFGKFTGATEAQTLKTWTMMETILGTTGAIVGMIAFTLLLNAAERVRPSDARPGKSPIQSRKKTLC
jgi:hypothetical protein